MPKKGAYLIFLQVQKSITLEVGKLGASTFPAGRYVYVGSASRGIEKRIARHRRLAETKAGKIHWHIDFLLTHPKVRFIRAQQLNESTECMVSHDIASAKEVTVPVPGFGSTDCRAGCRTHLYRMASKTQKVSRFFEPSTL